MQVEQAPSTIEKQEIKLLDEYHKCLETLYNGSIDQGIQGLKTILQNQITYSKEFDELRYSIYQSLAELSEKHSGQLTEAVYYLHQALKIREDFLEWKRLAGLCRRRGFLDQAEFCLKKSVGMAPMLNKDIIYEELCETYILNKHQNEAINLADELIARGFRTARAKSLKLVAVRQLLSESTVQDFVRRRLKLDEDILLSEGTTQNTFLALEQKELQSTRERYQERTIATLGVKAQPTVTHPLPFLMKESSSWSTLLSKLYLILKYSSIKEGDREKRKKNTRIYKQLEEFFLNKNMLKEPIKIVTGLELQTGELMADSERLDQLADSYLSFKRKKNKEAGPMSKLSSSEPDRQLIRISGNINAKDYLSNPAIHVDSLVHLQCKQKRKDMSKLHVMKLISEQLCPFHSFYPHIFSRFQEPVEMVEVMEVDRTADQRANTQVETTEGDSGHGSQQNAENEKTDVEVGRPRKKVSDLEKLTEQLLREDYLEFLKDVAGHCFINIFELVRRVVVHFTHNQFRESKLFELSSKESFQESLEFTPNYFLKSNEETCIKSFVKRIYLQSVKLCSGNLYPQSSCKVTLLELSVERYTDLNNKSLQGKNKDKLETLRKKKAQLHAHIIGLEGELFMRRDFAEFMNTLTEKFKTLLKLRVYHSLTIFFSLSDQENSTMLQKLIPKFESYQVQYKQKTGESSISLFWLDLGATKADLANYVDNRLKENRLQSQIEQRDVGRTDEMVEALQKSVDNFRKMKEKSVGEAVDLYYKNIMEMMSDEMLPFEYFLSHLGDILMLYLQILEKKPNREDYGRYINKADDLMKLEELVQQLIKRSNVDRDIRGRILEQSVRLSNLFLRIVLIKFFIQENENHNNSNLIKGLICCLSSLVKSMSPEQRSRSVPDLVLLMHLLAHIPNDNVSVHRKINSHFVSKYLEYLYDDKRMLSNEDSQSEDQQRAKPEDEPAPGGGDMQVEESSESENEHTSFRWEAEETLKCYYNFSQKKLSEFAPTTYKQIESFTRYLKFFHPRYFDEPSSKIKIPVCNILKAAEKILIEEKSKFCPGLEEARRKLIEMYVNNKRDEQFLGSIAQIISGNPAAKLCSCNEANCFEDVRRNRSAMVDTYYIVARSLQNQEYADNESNRTDVEKSYRHAEKLYQTVVCLDVSQGRSWYCLFKINKKKAYVYFDSLIYDEQPPDLKGSFLIAKKLALYAKEQPKLLDKNLRNELEEDLFILNLLKIYERKFLYLQSKESTPQDTETIKGREAKMTDAEQTIISKLESRSLRVQYLSLVCLIKPYEMRCHFHSSTCINLTQQFASLREAVRKNIEDEEEQCKVTDQEIYPELLFFLLKVVARYIDLIKLDPTNTKSVFADMAEWFQGIKETIPQLLIEREETVNYYQTYLSKDRTGQDRGRSDRYSNYATSVLDHHREEAVGSKQMPPTQVTISGINTMIGNIQLYLKQFIGAKTHTKKSRLMRNYTTCCFQLSRLQLQFEGNSVQALFTMSELVNIKFDQIIQVYRYYESQSLQRDTKLSQFFNRNLYYMLGKYKLIKYVIQLYFEVEDYEKIRVLYKKLCKLLLREDAGRINQAFTLLHRICLDMSIHSLWEMLVSKDYQEEFEKWLLQLYEKIIKPKKTVKSEHSEKIRALVSAYYMQKERDHTNKIPEAGRFEKGLALLEDKHRKKKAKESGAEAKRGTQVLIEELD